MAIDHKFSNTGACSLWELLHSDGQFVVPKFQRNYSWSSETVEELWSDLMEGFQSVKNLSEYTQDIQYLLGPVVLVRHENKKYWVIDGQQRLSTITMLFCVARDIIRENILAESNLTLDGYGKIMEMLENTRMGNHMSWKLVLNDTDKQLFRQIQDFEVDPKPQIERIKKLNIKTKSEKLLRDTYLLLHSKIIDVLYTNFGDEPVTSEQLQSMSAEEKKKLILKNHGMLNYFLTHIRENNFVVKIVVADDSTAYQIFETLNTRGQTLSRSNLIKNHLLNLIKDTEEQRDLSNEWNKIFDDIISQGQPDDEFILESLRSRRFDLNQKVSPKKLYKIIKNIIKNELQCRGYIADLKEDAEFLKTLNDPQLYEDNITRDDIQAMHVLKAKLIRVPILTAYRKWGVCQDYRNLVKFLLKLFFKIKIVQKTHAGTIEKIVLNAAGMIEQERPLNEILEELRIHDNHEDFVYNFRNKFALDLASDPAKYILQQITIHLGTRYADVRPVDSLSLEHVLPQKYCKWNNEDFFVSYEKDRKIDEFVYNLGNLTLLNPGLNAKAKNELFSHKKDVAYSKSELKINTATVCNNDEWTAVIIENRCNQFADLADKIWNLGS